MFAIFVIEKPQIWERTQTNDFAGSPTEKKNFWKSFNGNILLTRFVVIHKNHILEPEFDSSRLKHKANLFKL